MIKMTQLDNVFNISFNIQYIQGSHQGEARQHAIRCRQYRERSNTKRRREEEELRQEQERHNKLSKIYNRQKYMIARLKEYYLKSLRASRFGCTAMKKQEGANTPLVVIKTEIDGEEDLVIKTETVEEQED